MYTYIFFKCRFPSLLGGRVKAPRHRILLSPPHSVFPFLPFPSAVPPIQPVALFSETASPRTSSAAFPALPPTAVRHSPQPSLSFRRRVFQSPLIAHPPSSAPHYSSHRVFPRFPSLCGCSFIADSACPPFPVSLYHPDSSLSILFDCKPYCPSAEGRFSFSAKGTG